MCKCVLVKHVRPGFRLALMAFWIVPIPVCRNYKKLRLLRCIILALRLNMKDPTDADVYAFSAATCRGNIHIERQGRARFKRAAPCQFWGATGPAVAVSVLECRGLAGEASAVLSGETRRC